MKWTRCGFNYISRCGLVVLDRGIGQWWVRFDPSVAPNGIEVHPADTLKQAKAIAEATLRHADNRTGLRDELYRRLSAGERYRAALEAIRARCDEAQTVDSAGLRWLVEEALR